jgi:putative aminopeptidase
MNRNLLFLFLCGALVIPASAQNKKTPATVTGLEPTLSQLVATPAVSGYEQPLAALIRKQLARLSPRTDNLGNVIVTMGSGAPNRLLVAPMDEPGYVVSGITDDGYLRLQRLPQSGAPAMFDELYSAQSVRIGTRSGKWLDGVVAGASVHLQPGRMQRPNPADLDDVYLDIGASSPAEVRTAGVDLLDPVVLDRELRVMGYGKMTAPAIGDRFGTAALAVLAEKLDVAKVKGTLTIAFVSQQWVGARGLERLLDEVNPDEMIYVGRLVPSGAIAGTKGMRRAPRREPGSGVLVGLPQAGETLSGFAAELKQIADEQKISFQLDYSAPLLPRSYQAAPALPAKWAHLGVATSWPSTPAELLNFDDVRALTDLLEAYATGSVTPQNSDGGTASAATNDKALAGHASAAAFLKPLVEIYGVSGHEERVREAVTKLLPKWAKPEADDGGNLVLRVGTAPTGANTPRILVVAHMDEIGFEVKSILNDGKLEVETRGGGELRYFLGHVALVHTENGDRNGVMELPSGWDQAGFQWPTGRNVTLRVDVGARSLEEAKSLGIESGSTVTIPKKYRPLAGTRASGRSFDDRVGCAALLAATWALGGPLKDRNVTFVWSTREELGLFGAAEVAKRLAEEGREPDYVFAVDTFVSSDSPIESKRFADAKAGRGFVIRAVDNSNIVPSNLVDRVVRLARVNQIPVQYGVTGGGNDGSAFLRYGAIDVALGWPLRYSHSPGEVVDTRDVDALGKIVAAVARSW